MKVIIEPNLERLESCHDSEQGTKVQYNLLNWGKRWQEAQKTALGRGTQQEKQPSVRWEGGSRGR